MPRTTDLCLAISLRQAYLLNAPRADTDLSLTDLDEEILLICRKSKIGSYGWKKQILEGCGSGGKAKSTFDLSKQLSKVVPPEKGRDYEVWPVEIY